LFVLVFAILGANDQRTMKTNEKINQQVEVAECVTAKA
jgi:hypothetical protein